jgi:hypothetical protein
MAASLAYPEETWFAPGSPLWVDLLKYGALLSFTTLPIAVGFAVLRYRLYDIDILINRTLVYGSLTVSLVALYFGIRLPTLGALVLESFVDNSL